MRSCIGMSSAVTVYAVFENDAVFDRHRVGIRRSEVTRRMLGQASTMSQTEWTAKVTHGLDHLDIIASRCDSSHTHDRRRSAQLWPAINDVHSPASESLLATLRRERCEKFGAHAVRMAGAATLPCRLTLPLPEDRSETRSHHRISARTRRSERRTQRPFRPGINPEGHHPGTEAADLA